MKIAIGGDHAGFGLRAVVLEIVKNLGHEILDYGSFDPRPIDFPDITRQVCSALLEKKADRGILLCGSGVGGVVAANKIPGIRAAVCHDIYTAHQCVEHDDVNLICLGAKLIGPWLVEDLITRYLAAEFHPDEDTRRRMEKLQKLERSFAVAESCK